MIHSFDTLLLEYLYIHGHGVQSFLSFFLHPFQLNTQTTHLDSKLTTKYSALHKEPLAHDSPLTSP